jgi:hypothetical protein
MLGMQTEFRARARRTVPNSSVKQLVAERRGAMRIRGVRKVSRVSTRDRVYPHTHWRAREILRRNFYGLIAFLRKLSTDDDFPLMTDLDYFGGD